MMLPIGNLTEEHIILKSSEPDIAEDMQVSYVVVHFYSGKSAKKYRLFLQ